MSDAEAQARFPEFYAMAEERNVPYPLVVINGELRWAGSAHYYQLLPLVQGVLGPESVLDPEAVPS